MKTVMPFDFATVVCDGCACRVDSTIDDERLHDYEDLIGWILEDSDWQRVQEDNDEKWYCPDCARSPNLRKHPGEGRVIIETVPLFGLKCDHCGQQWSDSWEGHTSCADFGDTEQQANDDYWKEIGGKWYCPDCWKSCRAMEPRNFDVENWEEVFCSGCRYKDDCNEVELREIPQPNRDECPPSCQYLKGSTAVLRCEASEDAKCPRVQEWEKEGRAKLEAENAAALAKCKKGEKKCEG